MACMPVPINLSRLRYGANAALFWDVFALIVNAALRQQRPNGLHMLHDIDLREIFEQAHFRFTI